MAYGEDRKEGEEGERLKMPCANKKCGKKFKVGECVVSLDYDEIYSIVDEEEEAMNDEVDCSTRLKGKYWHLKCAPKSLLKLLGLESKVRKK